LFDCPEYRLEIRDNGTVLWDGHSHVATLGPAQSETDPAKVQKLFTEIFGQETTSVCRVVQGLDGQESILLFSAVGKTNDLEKLGRAAPKNCFVKTNVLDALSTIERNVDSHRWVHGKESIIDNAKVWEDATYFTKPGFTDLMAAVALDDVSRMDKLMKPEAVNSADETGWTPLMIAASQCSVDGVKKLIENGADPHLADQKHKTALMAAASSRCFRNNLSGEESKARMALSKSLIASGAVVNAQDDEGQTALIIAVEFANPEATKGLLSAGADVSIKDHNGMTALTYAKNLQQQVHRTYNRHYWSRYERYYQEIIANLTQAEKK